jgi:hypothetical protein
MAVPRKRADAVQVHVVQGGHFVLDDNPDAVVSAIRSHLVTTQC